MSSTRTGRVARTGHQPPVPGAATIDTTTRRWLWVWIAVGALVVVVVVAFLLGIVSALQSVDGNLDVASSAVTDAEGDVAPLPVHIQEVNEALEAVAGSAQPLHPQAVEILSALRSIDSSLEDVDASLGRTGGSLTSTSGHLDGTAASLGTIVGSLGDTATSLEDTAGSLVDTSTVLDTVLRRARRVELVLESAESPPDDLGASDIFMRVADANRELRGVVADTGNIVPALVEVNKHLDSICNSPAVATIGAAQGDVECN